jgi:uncharacterized phage protein gp47/JayE
MANLPLQNFASLVGTMVAAAQAAASSLTNFVIGTVDLALVEASATVMLWLQWAVLQALSLTRASSSNGPDLVSWMADFSFVRIAAVAATGTETLGRYSSGGSGGSTAYAYPGAQVKTADGTQTFTLIADPTNSTGNWNVGQQAYQITGTNLTINVLVQAVNLGTQGNVAANTVTLLASSMPGFDYCNNATPFANGLNAESDAAFRARFVLYINSRSLGTALAIEWAVDTTQQGLSSYIDVSPSNPGVVNVYIDDGSGAVPGNVISAVQTAVNAVAPIGTSIYVLQAPVTNAAINVVFTSAPGFVHSTQITDISNAIAAMQPAVAATLPYTDLAATVFNSTPGIAAVPTLTINSAQSDLPPNVAYGVVHISAITVA